MLKCRELARLVASDEFAEAGWWRRAAMRFHLFMCRDCTRYASQLRLLGAAVRDLGQRDTPSDARLKGLERSILERLAKGPGDDGS